MVKEMIFGIMGGLGLFVYGEGVVEIWHNLALPLSLFVVDGVYLLWNKMLFPLLKRAALHIVFETPFGVEIWSFGSFRGKQDPLFYQFVISKI